MRHGTNYSSNSYLKICFLVATPLVLGCSNGDRPDLGSVVGTVTLDGEPMPDAMVQFYQEGLRPSKALTSSDGTYELVYLRNIKGVALGTHKVYIDRVTEQEVTPKHLRLPARYNVESTLKAEVEPGKNVVDWVLTSDK